MSTRLLSGLLIPSYNVTVILSHCHMTTYFTLGLCHVIQVAILKDNVRKADEEIVELDKLVESITEVRVWHEDGLDS